MFGNAFARHQGGMFIPCEGCTMSQECGIHGRCYRDICQIYNQQQIGLGCALSGAPSWDQPTARLQRGEVMMRLREVFEKIMRNAFEKRYGPTAYARWLNDDRYVNEVVEASWLAFQEGAKVQPDAWKDE